jgi:hypothetical protein
MFNDAATLREFYFRKPSVLLLRLEVKFYIHAKQLVKLVVSKILMYTFFLIEDRNANDFELNGFYYS